jgi:hypothetical protein
MIDFAINKIGQDGETKDTIACYLEGRKEFCDFDNDNILIPFSPEMMQQKQALIDKIRKTDDQGYRVNKFDNEELKTELLKLKQRQEGSKWSVKQVTKVINVADSLHVTAQEQKQAGLTSVQLLSELDRLLLSDKLSVPKFVLRNNSTTHQQLQNLFDKLIQTTPDTSKEDLRSLFETYKLMTRLMDHSDAFDHLDQAQGEGIDAPFDRFYRDLQRPDSTFLTLLDGEIQKKRISANQAKKEVQFLERQERSLGYLKFKKWTDPTEGLVFFDLFHKFNNLTLQKPIIAWPVEWMNSSVKDQSLSSFWATMGITSLVASYVLYKVAQFFLSLAIAAVCYAFCTTAWGLATLVRDFFGQGVHCIKHKLTTGEIRDLSKKNLVAMQSRVPNPTAIQNAAPNGGQIWVESPGFNREVILYENKIKTENKGSTRLLKHAFQTWTARKDAAIKLQKAFRGRKARRAVVERILQAGQQAEELLANYREALVAFAAAGALEEARIAGMNTSERLQASRRAERTARANPESMSRSMGHAKLGDA